MRCAASVRGCLRRRRPDGGGAGLPRFRTAQAAAGATGAVVLAESHLAVHTWPERRAVTLDLYVCNFSQDNRSAAETAWRALLDAFRPQQLTRRDVQRGSLVRDAAPGRVILR
ncbi:MAG: S-adenosylmethionine decarboxylase [Comamonadaceae bacterium]|nr:S-adenosylmethionine decarboxylase [Comamonadaceae bacterium]